MATANVKVNIHRGKVITVCGPMIDKAAYRAAQQARGYVMSEIIAAGRVKTGSMIRGLQVRRQPGSNSMHPIYEVMSTAKHTVFQNDGTRAHGPRSKKVMAWQGPSGMIFAKWVRGVQGAHFMERGLARVRVSDFVI